MPSATYGTPYANKAPIFFCSHGAKNHCTEELKSSFTVASLSTPFPFAWPAGKRLRVKVLPNQITHPEILDIIKSAFEEWLPGLSETIGYIWVSSGEQADIRISFRNEEPNWSAWGAKAVFYEEATMNFQLGGWKETLTVWPQATIRRAAGHLFGHALGIPHANGHWANSPWDVTKLEENYGSWWANKINLTGGSKSLNSPQTIMGFDRPASLSTSKLIVRNGGPVVDAECLSFLKTMYTLPTVYSRHTGASQVPGWGPDVGEHWATQRQYTDHSANIITGLSRLDMGLNDGFRLQTTTREVNSAGFDVKIGCWGSTHLIDASCSILSFKPDDMRVQTGTEDFSDSKPGGPSGENVRGRSISKRINFVRPWRSTPNVVAFIRGFDIAKDANLRISVTAAAIDKNGFTLNFGTFANTLAWNLQAGWLAHEADECSIRSGNLDTPQRFPNSCAEYPCTLPYTSSMVRNPQALFYAFNYIDVDVSHNLRLQLETTWDENAVRGIFSTWRNESAFFCLKGCYVAVL